MSTEQPDFPYDPKTGECEAPSSPPNKGFPGQPVGVMQPLPIQTGNSYRQSPSPYQKPQRSRKDRIVGTIYSLIQQHYYKALTPRGTALLVERNSLKATLLETGQLVHDIQSYALNISNIAVTVGEVEQAIGAIKGDQAEIFNLNGTTGLTVRGEQEEIFLTTPQGVIVIYPQGGYQLASHVPFTIAFMRLAHGLPPCYPALSGQVSIQPLFEFLNRLNVPQDSQLLVLAWLVTSLHPMAEKVLLEIVGMRSSGKSTLQERLRALIDPSRVPLIEDIPTTASQTYTLSKQHHVISLDNVSQLNEKTQRALLSLLKGKVVDLRSSSKEKSAPCNIVHPVVLNSADSVVTWADLADHSILVELPPLNMLPPHGRHQGPQIEAQTQHAFASLIELLNCVNQHWQTNNLLSFPPKMANFYRVGVAIANAVGLGQDAFDQQLKGSMKRRFELELCEYPVATAIRDLLGASEEDCLDLPMMTLLDRLNDYRPEDICDSEWPRSPRHLGAKLNECATLLKSCGVSVGPSVKKGKRGDIHRKIEKCKPDVYHTNSYGDDGI